MKKIFAGIVLPTLAAVAVIGSGFSIWFFGENQDKVSTTASVAVENLLRIGDLKADSSEGLLHLDQTQKVRTKLLASSLVNTEKDGKFDKKSNFAGEGSFGTGVDAKGLYLSKKNDGDTFTGKISYTKPDITEGLQGAQVEIKTTFKFTGGLEKFVGMDTTTTTESWESTTTAGEYVFNWGKDSVSNDRTKTLPLDNGEGSFNFKFVYLNYEGSSVYTGLPGKDTKRDDTADAYSSPMNTVEPHTDAEYKYMLGAVKGGKLTIETVATIIA